MKHVTRNNMKRYAVTLLTSMTLGLATQSAFAAPINHAGGVTQQSFAVTQTDALTTAAAAFVPLPAASIVVTVPAGKTRLIKARFSGESACYDAAAWCSVRIMLQFPSGALLEMNPVVGTDFAFDSSDSGAEGGGSWEAHSIDRSRRIGAGTYRVFVQWGVVGVGTFWLDDWSFNVEVVA